MRDFEEYKNLVESEIKIFDMMIPNSKNSARGMSEKITKFLEVLPKVEAYIEIFCKNYYEEKELNVNDKKKLLKINNEIYLEFINRAQIPGISKKINKLI